MNEVIVANFYRCDVIVNISIYRWLNQNEIFFRLDLQNGAAYLTFRCAKLRLLTTTKGAYQIFKRLSYIISMSSTLYNKDNCIKT